MNYWDSVGRWINTLLLFIVGIISFDTLFRLLEAQESNVIVGVTRLLAGTFLVPFRGMFGDQEYVLTSLVAVLGYALLAGIALSVLRGVQATRVAPRVLDDRAQYPPRPGSVPQRAAGSRPANRRRDPQAGRAPAGNGPDGRSPTAPNTRADGINRNGRLRGAPVKDNPPRRSDGTAPGVPDRTTPGVPDGTPPLASDGAVPARPDTATRTDDVTSQRPNGAVADTATTPKVQPAERDGRDD